MSNQIFKQNTHILKIPKTSNRKKFRFDFEENSVKRQSAK